jgi:hypothetical protein
VWQERGQQQGLEQEQQLLFSLEQVLEVQKQEQQQLVSSQAGWRLYHPVKVRKVSSGKIYLQFTFEILTSHNIESLRCCIGNLFRILITIFTNDISNSFGDTGCNCSTSCNN